LIDGHNRALWRMKEVIKVYIHHADYATGRNAYPSYATIAEATGLRVRSIPRIVKAAVEADLLIPDGKGPGGSGRYHLNLLADFEALRKPFVEAQQHRAELAAERWRNYKQRQQGVRTNCVVDPDPNAVDAYLPSLPDLPVKDHPSPLSDAAAASLAEDVLDAELIDDELPGLEGPPLLAIEPPSTDLVPVSAVPAVPNLSESWLLPEVAETGKRKRSAPVDAPRFDAEAWQMPREQHTPSEWTKTLVGLFVEAARGFGFEPSGRQIGQVGKEVKGLVAAGNNPVHILAAVRRAAEKRGAWVMRAMADVQPGNWSAQRPGRQVVLNDRTISLPQGATAYQARAVSLAALFPDA
jgi:hypothetical protein